ncbi:MAG TPA: HDOD domain-containing protein, partial [Planctomycetota bacterium]|nr:HDOD domain-containing protein [Planctomycetota bacterium]
APKAGPAPLPPAVADLLGDVRELWGAPASVIQALQLMASPDAAPDAVAAALQRDGALADRVLRLAGASPSGGGAPPTTLKAAAVALGYPLLRRLTTAAAVLGPLLDGPGWSHALRTASTAALLARATKTGSPDDHFTAGLVHDVGRAALSRHWPGATPGVSLGTIGACILERWRFPASHVESARHEGLAPEAVEDVQLPREALVVAAACAAVQGRGAGWATLLRLPEPRLKEAAAQAAALVDPVARALGGPA